VTRRPFGGTLLLAAAALFTAGCATPWPPPSARSAEALSGRLSVRVEAADAAPARAVSASFELRGNADAGELDLSTPLGTLMGRARWNASGVVLMTPQGERRYDDLGSLTQEVLGESLPVAALFDWLRGRPWSGAASVPNTPPAEPGFEQLGWAVGLARFEDAQITARRNAAPVVTVRAQLDPP
jgi:outer membrane lipoprotein LolB